jgi:hypothetical protein
MTRFSDKSRDQFVLRYLPRKNTRHSRIAPLTYAVVSWKNIVHVLIFERCYLSRSANATQRYPQNLFHHGQKQGT